MARFSKRVGGTRQGRRVSCGGLLGTRTPPQAGSSETHARRDGAREPKRQTVGGKKEGLGSDKQSHNQ